MESYLEGRVVHVLSKIDSVTFFTDQRNMGMSMKVEKSSLDQVRKRFEFNKKKKEEDKKTYGESNCMTEEEM